MIIKRIVITLLLGIPLLAQAMAPHKAALPVPIAKQAQPVTASPAAPAAPAPTPTPTPTPVTPAPAPTPTPVTPVPAPVTPTPTPVSPVPVVPSVPTPAEAPAVVAPAPAPVVVPAPAPVLPTPPVAAPVITPPTPQQTVATPVDSHNSTSTVNDNLSTITLTGGATHELDPLHDVIERYVVQAPGYVSYLHREEQDSHQPAVYSLVAPKNAKAGTFIVFKGQGTGMHATKVEPAFKVVVTESEEALESELPDFKKMVQEAWVNQEEAEERYFIDIKERFEQLRSELRSIWFDVSLADGNFEELFSKKDSIKTVSKKLLRLAVGEEKVVATGSSGSISSLNPKIVAGKMNAIKKGSATVWQLQITASEAGSTQVTYTVDGITYILPIVVENKVITHDSLQELEKPGERKEGVQEDEQEEAEDDDLLSASEDEDADEGKELIESGSQG